MVPPAGVGWGALFVTGRAEMCADPPNVNVGLCSAHGTPQRDHHGGWGWPLVVRSVPLWYVSQPQAVPGLSAPHRERTKTEAATALRCSPEPPDQQNVVTNQLEYSPHLTPSGTFEPLDLILTWGGRPPGQRRPNTRGTHYFASGAFCGDLLPARVQQYDHTTMYS